MIVIFDFDGTLSLNEHRQHFLHEKPKNWKAFNEACGDDKPNSPIREIYFAMTHDRKYILTGRSEEMRFDSIDWLLKYTFDGWEGLYMRKKGDRRDDTIVKKELFLELKNDLARDCPGCTFKNHEFVIFEDRQKVVDMWREMGLTCCQVAPGNF